MHALDVCMYIYIYIYIYRLLAVLPREADAVAGSVILHRSDLDHIRSCIYIYIYIHTHTYIHTYIHTNIHTYIHTYTLYYTMIQL